MPIASGEPLLLGLIGIAFVAGVLGSLLGLGGGVILVPALTLLLGVDIRYAIAASIVCVIATSTGSAATYIRNGTSNLRLGMFLEMGTTSGAITGALIGSLASARFLYVVFAVVMGASAYAVICRRREGEPIAVQGDRLSRRLQCVGSYYDRTLGERVSYWPCRTLPGMGLHYLAGMVSGLLGIGGGALQVPALDLVMRLPIKAATATSSMVLGVTAAASAAIYFLRGQIDPGIAGPVVVGSFLGTLMGTKLMARLSGRTLRMLLTGLLAILAVQMLAKALF